MEQINRLMEIIFTLLSKDSVTAKELADKFGVSVRTIYRDVDTLSVAEIPIIMTKGKNGGIKLLENYKIDRALLTEKDKQEVLSSLNIFGSLSPETSQVASKLRSIFRSEEDDIIEIDFDNWSNETGQKELFCQLKKSIKGKTKVVIDYYSVSGNSNRIVCPLKLCFKSQAWYLYAYCAKKDGFRFFKLNRIRGLKSTNETFKLKAKENVLKDLHEYNDTFIDLTLKISKEKAYRVYDEFRDIEVLDNGDFIVKIKYPIGDFIYQYIASFLGDCQVISPQEVKDKMAEINRKALSKN